MMIIAKNIIIKERIWITVKLTLGGLIPACCAGPLDTSQMTGGTLLVTTRKGDQAPTWSLSLQFKRNPVCTWILPERGVPDWMRTPWKLPAVWTYSRSSWLHVQECLVQGKGEWVYWLWQQVMWPEAPESSRPPACWTDPSLTDVMCLPRPCGVLTDVHRAHLLHGSSRWNCGSEVHRHGGIVLIEKWCQSEQSAHLDTDRTSTENFVKSSNILRDAWSDLCYWSAQDLNPGKCRGSQHFSLKTEFVKGCVNTLEFL